MEEKLLADGCYVGGCKNDMDKFRNIEHPDKKEVDFLHYQNYELKQMLKSIENRLAAIEKSIGAGTGNENPEK